MSLRTRMIVLIAVPTLVIYVVVLGLTMISLKRAAREDVQRDMSRLAAHYAGGLDGAFRETAAIATTTARLMETAPDLTEARIFAQLSANTLQNPAVYGAAMAFEPGTFRDDDSLFCPYVYRKDGSLAQMNISRDDLDWYGEERWQWWHVPKRTGSGAWTDPYHDDGAGNVLMVTYSAPFLRDGAFRGVTTVDIMLPTLQERIGRSIVDDLDFVILTAAGQFVYSPDSSAIMNRTIFDSAEDLDRPDLAAMARRILSGSAGVETVDGWDTPERQWVFHAPIESTGWTFASRLPERVALADMRRRMSIASIALTATLLMIIACIAFVSGRITRPIKALRTKVIDIAHGDLDAHVDGITSTDEIGDLARSFNRMTADLRSHVEQLAEEQANREKIERDLDLAREIQRGLMPTEPPDIPGFEVAGWNLAAEQTGGDYFDWLELPDGRLIFTLADVTGHGIGPALIVAVCRAYMRAATAQTSLNDALERVNDLLHADTPADRFVTAVVGAIDPVERSVTMISAGQAPLLFYEADTSTVHNWDADTVPLGIAAGIEFDSVREIDFRPGDRLVLTTDGFFEWQNAAGEQYGIERLVEFVRAHHEMEPAAFIERLHATVLGHAGGTEQADDLTALVITAQ